MKGAGNNAPGSKAKRLRFTAHQIASLTLSNPDKNSPFLVEHSLKRAGTNILESKKRRKIAQFGANRILARVALGQDLDGEVLSMLLDFAADGARIRPI